MHSAILACCMLATGAVVPAQQILQPLSYWDFASNYTPMGDRDGDGYEDVLTISHIYVGLFPSAIDYEVRLYSRRDASLIRRGPRWAYPNGAFVYPHGDHDGDGIQDYICYVRISRCPCGASACAAAPMTASSGCGSSL